MTRTMRLTAMATVGALLAAGCSGGSNDTPRTQTLTPSPSTATTTATPTPTLEPQVQAALDSYLAFAKAAEVARRDPQAFLDGKNPAADFRQYSWDPMMIRYTVYVSKLAQQKVAYRGTPPQPRVVVQSVDMKAKPYPKVVLTDCQTPAPDWHAYRLATGKRVPEPSSSIPRPWLITATIIYYKGRWGMAEASSDESRTCTVD